MSTTRNSTTSAPQVVPHVNKPAIVGEVYPHKLEVSETNPAECRPHLQFPWHADGPPADGPALANEDAEKVHEVWCRYLERMKQDPRGRWTFTVRNELGCMCRGNVRCRRSRARCVRSSLTRSAAAPKSLRSSSASCNPRSRYTTSTLQCADTCASCMGTTLITSWTAICTSPTELTVTIMDQLSSSQGTVACDDDVYSNILPIVADGNVVLL